MHNFLDQPTIHFETKEDLLEALANPTSWYNNTHKWSTRSRWLVDLIHELIATDRKYTYNVEIQLEAEKRLGIAPMPENGSPLSVLVYNAQHYRHDEDWTAKGYVPLTLEMMQEAFASKKKIDLGGDNVLTVRESQGELRLFRPRERARYYLAFSKPARMVDTKYTGKSDWIKQLEAHSGTK